MEKFELDGNKVFIDWYPESVTVFEIDEWVNKNRLVYDPEEEIIVVIEHCGPGPGGSLIDGGLTLEELRKIIPPNPNKPYRIRLANRINFIVEIYNTLRKLNYVINSSLKEDVISETIIYFMNRWDKYEYHPRTLPIAVQKYKSLNIDIYRKDKKNISIQNDDEGYLPKSLESIEGLPLEEIEKKQDFKMVKEAISEMDENCRELLTYVSDGKSESEIQEILDIPLGTVSSRKSNCIKKLAEIMKL